MDTAFRTNDETIFSFRGIVRLIEQPTMKREESALDFLENLEDLRRTPLHHLPGYQYLKPPVPVADLSEDELDLLAEEHKKQEEETRALTIMEEREKLLSDPHNFVRSKIKQQVQDVVWLDLLRDQLKRKVVVEEVSDRCIICTLPYGKCVHTQDNKPEEKLKAFSRADLEKDDVDRALDDVLGIMGGSLDVNSLANASEDIDLDTMRWVDLHPDRADRIGDQYMALSTPPPRGWHTCTILPAINLLIVFGGFRFRTSEVPQPFSVAPKEGEVEYLSDIYRHDLITKAWFGSNAGSKRKELHPTGRYGHVAAPIGDQKMMIFGGKASHGRYLSDTWIYDALDDAWTLIEPNSASPPPTPRNFSSCARLGSKVYLFGGTDGVENFGDLWVFHIHIMRWERSIAVGIPPAPRYGHAMVALHNPNVQESRLCVVGGCCVSPQSEVFGTAATPEEIKRMLDLGMALEASYLKEGDIASVGGKYLQSISNDSAKGQGDLTLKDIYKKSAGITGQLYESETRTRQAEKDLVLAHNLMEASRSLKLQKAKHPMEKLDVHFLDVEDLMWKPQVYPPISGEFPCARMHFGAISLGGYLIVCGGAKPTSLKNVCIDTDHTRLYALNLQHSAWTQPAPRETSEFLELPLSIAESDVMRAKVRVQMEKDRGKALGARNGMTLELAEAEAVLKVCQWRHSIIHAEKVNMTQPPAPCWGMSFVMHRSRGFLFSGWNKDKIVLSRNMYVLDLEQEHERRRREDDEFHQKLETNRRNEEARNASANMQSAYELQQMLKAEKTNEAKERQKMVLEDVLSCVPPLTKPQPVRLVKANQHSMWLEWDPVVVNSVGTPLRPDEVKYNLYMINGYEHFAAEDRVLVMPQEALDAIAREKAVENGDDDDMSILTTESKKEKSKFTVGASVRAGGSVGSSAKSGSKTSKSKAKLAKSNFADYRGPGFPGEVVAVHKAGFDISYDDGAFEQNVHRSRMKLAKPRRVFDDDENMQDLPEGMTLAQFDKLKEEKKKRKDLLDSLQMLNKDSYIIEDDMAIVTKKRIKRKFEVRELKLEKLQNFIDRGSTIRPFNLSKSKKVRHRLSDKSSVSKDAGANSNATAEVLQLSSSHKSRDGDSEDGSDAEDNAPEITDAERQINKLRELFEHGYDRNQYIENLRHQQGQKVTVQVHPSWELVYSGEAPRTEVTNLVPREVMLYDRNFTVPVNFVLQVCGADFPSYENSELSEVVEFRTKVDQSVRHAGGPLSTGLGNLTSHSSKQNSDVSPMGTPPPVMKKEKQTFSCMVRGKMVEFEIEKDTVSGWAQGDYYM